MSQFKVVVTDQVFPDVERERAALAEIDATLVVADGDRDAVLTASEDADALLTTYFAMDAEAIERLRNCRIIARYGIGVDNIDLDAARGRDIVVTNVPDYSVEEVATHTVAMLLGVLRKLPDGDRVVRNGGWGIHALRPMRRLSTLAVGIVGLGRIGRRVAHLLAPFECRLLGYDPYVTKVPGLEFAELDRLLRESDAVTLHSPLTPETRGMIGAQQLSRMRPGAVLVNTSRGPLVELDALLSALKNGPLGAAALDVFETEPPDAAAFADVPNLLATPHSAFYSDEAIAESQTKATAQVCKALLDKPVDYRVN